MLLRCAVSAFVLLLSALVPSAAFAQAKERAAAREGLTAYNGGDIETALKKFQEAEPGLDKLQIAEQVLVRRYLAYCQIAFGRREEGKKHFAAAFALDHKFDVDPKIVSPKILVVYEESKKERDLALVKPTPAPMAGMSRGKVAGLSAAAPGLGQFMSGRKLSGGVFAGATVASAGAAIYLHSQATLAESYIDKAGPDERPAMYSQAKRFSSQRDLALGALAVVWAGAVADGFLRTPSGPRPSAPSVPARRVGIAPAVEPGGAGLVFFGEF